MVDRVGIIDRVGSLPASIASVTPADSSSLSAAPPMNEADLRSRRAAALEESGDVGLSEYLDKAAGERIARALAKAKGNRPRQPAASGSAARRCIASGGGWVTNRSASGAPMSQANNNSSRGSLCAASATGKRKSHGAGYGSRPG